MAEQSRSRLQGDRYQHLYSWYELLGLLDDDTPFEYAIIEHPDAGAADDITFHPRLPTDAARFVQVKWHVDHRDIYSLDSLVNEGLVPKLYRAWDKLCDQWQAEIWLVSNWAADARLGALIDGSTYSLSNDFLTARVRTILGRARQKWLTELHASDDQLASFWRALRLRLGFSAIGELYERIDDRMGRRGLRTGPSIYAIVVDEVSRRIEKGGASKRLDRQEMNDTVDRLELRSQTPDEPSVSMWIHGWAKRAYDVKPTVELDWTDYFDRKTRTIPDASLWIDTLIPHLEHAQEELLEVSTDLYIDFRGKLPLTAVLAVGATFPEVGGYSFRVEQPTAGETHLWTTQSPPSDLRFEILAENLGDGHDVLVAFAVTGSARDDVQDLFDAKRRDLRAVVYAEPVGGASDICIGSGSQAASLAISAKTVMRESKQRYSGQRIHLVLYAPASFCLFLGQRLNALGTIVTYERALDGTYQQSVVLETG